MAKKKRGIDAETTPGEGSTIRERVVFLLRAVWGNNRSAMASELGFSHTAIVKIVQGEREPGRGLLASLASHPKVNPQWLKEGKGEPLLTKESQLSSAAWARPISRDLLSGFGDEMERLSASDTFQLGVEGPSYFFRAAGNEPIALDDNEKVMPDDLFLMVPVPPGSRGDPHFFDGRICAVRRPTGNGSTLLLARVRCRLEQQGTSWRLTVRLPDAIPPRPIGRERVIQLDPSGTTGKPSSQKAAKMTETSTITPEDIVAFAALLVRRP
jgi:hypothetical protein